MIKKFLITFGLFLALVMGLALVISQIWPKSNPPDPYITQAQRDAQLADIERSRSASDFYTHFFQFAVAAVFFVVLAAGIAFVVWFCRERAHAHKVEMLKLRRDWNRLFPDQNGSYPAWLDTERGEIIRVRPANPADPRPSANFIVGNSPAVQVKEGRNRADVPILINPGLSRSTASQNNDYRVREVRPEQLEQPAEGRRQSVQTNVQDERLNLENVGTDTNVQDEDGERSNEVQDFSELLAQAKDRGEGKQYAIETITGVKKGGGKAWRVYSEYWDNLPKL